MIFTATTGDVRDSLRVSKNTLARMRADGIFRPGVHFVALGTGSLRASLRWDLAAVEATLQKRSRQMGAPKHDNHYPARKKAQPAA
ncbi:hypothetical protein [Cyanobium sp. N5-Cardenillas]|uniref:hypothetical protein n=1 Tax=Cyanobium sp. N5-Cardenillas TaxID=2823720 RepID=UPI0020CBA503|nr:hypothetical protein [Cyanobium sp. N5-Cardenillas]MCP9786792.1 hypothetical protein [Cyanobium sp. N5-Cardenillas]